MFTKIRLKFKIKDVCMYIYVYLVLLCFLLNYIEKIDKVEIINKLYMYICLTHIPNLYDNNYSYLNNTF